MSKPSTAQYEKKQYLYLARTQGGGAFGPPHEILRNVYFLHGFLGFLAKVGHLLRISIHV